MKKTLKLILATLFALLVLVSCENKPEEANKTALDYLAGRTIIASLEFSYEDEGEPVTAFFWLPVGFDKDGELYSTSAKIVDFDGTVDGMVYKTTFKEKYIGYDEELDEYVEAYNTYSIDFKVLNKSKVVVSGSMVYDGESIQFEESEASISGDLPSWFTSSDWVYIPGESDEYSMDFSIIDEKLTLDTVMFGTVAPANVSVNISSNNGVVLMHGVQSGEIPGMKMSNVFDFEFTKLSDEEAKAATKYSSSWNNTETKIEEGTFSSFTVPLKRVDSLPEWAEGIYSLSSENAEYYFLPVSNTAIASSYYVDNDVIDFQRVVDEDSIEMSITYGYEEYIYELDDYVYTTKKIEFTINKPATEGVFSCTVYECEIDEEGNEVLPYTTEGDDFIPSDIFSAPIA